jgi:hypothetical protein
MTCGNDSYISDKDRESAINTPSYDEWLSAAGDKMKKRENYKKLKITPVAAFLPCSRDGNPSRRLEVPGPEMSAESTSRVPLPGRQASLDHHLHGIALTARPHHGEPVAAPG